MDAHRPSPTENSFYTLAFLTILTLAFSAISLIEGRYAENASRKEAVEQFIHAEQAAWNASHITEEAE